MVTKAEKSRSLQFICDRLEDSGLYLVLGVDYKSVSVREKPEVNENPRTVDVVIPNFLGKIDHFVRRLHGNAGQNIHTSPVFYKDGKTAFVRMVDRNQSWHRKQYLKNYSSQQINLMLHLRGMEKKVMELFGKILTYYQPETERLEESLREFDFGEVIFDCSDINPGDPGYGFVKDGLSIDYKLPVEVKTIEPAASFLFNSDDHLRRAPLTPSDSLKYLMGSFEEERSHPSEELGERIAICLDSCSENGRRTLTRIYGAEAFGGCAVEEFL